MPPRLVHVKEAALDGQKNRLCAVRGSGFVENAADMDADGVFGNAQPPTGFAIAATARQQSQDFQFPCQSTPTRGCVPPAAWRWQASHTVYRP